MAGFVKVAKTGLKPVKSLPVRGSRSKSMARRLPFLMWRVPSMSLMTPVPIVVGRFQKGPLRVKR